MNCKYCGWPHSLTNKCYPLHKDGNKMSSILLVPGEIFGNVSDGYVAVIDRVDQFGQLVKKDIILINGDTYDDVQELQSIIVSNIQRRRRDD